MRTVFFAIACLACVGHGRRTQAKEDLQIDQDASSSLNNLASLLQAVKPSAGYQVPGVGQGRGAAMNSRAASGLQKFANEFGGKVLAAGLVGVLALTAGTDAAVAGPFTRSEIAGLTYDQIKGTGLANTCPQVEAGGTSSIATGSLKKLNEFCLEPTTFQVIGERQMNVNGKVQTVEEPLNVKVTTRQTYTLTGIDGQLSSKDGKLVFTEQDGIDYAPTSVQLPGGERVPFLFTVKNLVATADKASDKIEPGLKLSGSFKVPSYRTGLFLDPKGRGTTTGYDQAQALPALQATDDDELFKENNKKFEVGTGSLELKVTSVNSELKEIGGVFVQKQPSDTDLGSKAPKELLLKGNWFATVE